MPTKLAPLTVRVKAAPPAIAEAGAIEVIDGSGLVVVKFTLLEDPPPGAGLVTLTGATPADAIRVAGTCAVSWVALT